MVFSLIDSQSENTLIMILVVIGAGAIAIAAAFVAGLIIYKNKKR